MKKHTQNIHFSKKFRTQNIHFSKKFRTQNIHFSIKTHPKSFVSNFWDAYHFDPVPFIIVTEYAERKES